MECTFCGRSFNNLEELQLHQFKSCPAVEEHEEDTALPTVQFKWLIDRDVKDVQSIHLLATEEINNIELHRKDDSFESSPLKLKEGAYSGQLVIGDEIVPLAQYAVDGESDVIFLIVDAGDTSYESATEISTDLVNNNDTEQQVSNAVFKENSYVNIPNAIGEQRDSESEEKPPIDDDQQFLLEQQLAYEKYEKQHQLQHEHQQLQHEQYQLQQGQIEREQYQHLEQLQQQKLQDVDPHLQQQQQNFIQQQQNADQHFQQQDAEQLLHFQQQQEKLQQERLEQQKILMANYQQFNDPTNINQQLRATALTEEEMSRLHSAQIHSSCRSGPVDKDSLNGSEFPTDSEDARQPPKVTLRKPLTTQVLLSPREQKSPRTKSPRKAPRSKHSSVSEPSVEEILHELSVRDDDLEVKNEIADAMRDVEPPRMISSPNHLDGDENPGFAENGVVLELENRIHVYNEENTVLKKEVNRLNELVANYKEIRIELEKRCESYDDEIARLNRVISVMQQQKDQELKESYGEINNLRGTLNELEERCNSLNHLMSRKDFEHQQLLHEMSVREKCSKEVENLRAHIEFLDEQKHENFVEFQSSIAQHRKREDDMKVEIDNLQRVVEMLQRDQQTNNNQNKCFPFNSTNNYARTNIDKLQKENQLLKDKLNVYRVQSELAALDQLEPRGTSAVENPYDASPELYRHVEAPVIERPLSPMEQHDGIDHVDYNVMDHVDYNSHSSTKPKKKKHRSTKESKSTSSLQNKTNIDQILKRYSTESTNGHHSSSRSRNHTTDYNYSETADYMEPPDSPVQQHFSSNTWSRKVKSRSLDRGLDAVGLSQGESLESLRESLTQIPFCPTNVRDLKIGMKIKINRSTGRLSRGVVKWVGRLPNQTGEYVGVELETETGKNSGDFEGYQYFNCKHNRGVFVRFKKVIMGWK